MILLGKSLQTNNMPLSQIQKQQIQEVVKNILLKRTENFPDLDQENRNAPFHELFLKAFQRRLGDLKVPIPYLTAIASWMHGLNTSLGTGFESLAHILSGGYKRRFTRAFRLNIKQAQAHKIDTIIRDLKAGTHQPNLKRENDLIFSYNNNDKTIQALEFTADNYLEKKTCIEAIELKSVRPNSGEARGEKQKILQAKAAFKLLHPQKDIKFFIGFPFEPTSKNPTEYNKGRFFNYLIEFKKFFDPSEVLIAGELWDRLSGQPNTMEELLNVISQTIKEFLKN